MKPITPDDRKRLHAKASSGSTDKIIERKESPIKYILDQQKLRTRQDLLKLRIAIDDAENVVSYNREMLHNIFREAEKDLSLQSNWESRKLKVLQRTFKMINPKSKEENEGLTAILEAQWFTDWVNACLDSKKWGFSLIEFGPLFNGEFLPYSVTTDKGKKNFEAVTVIDRDNVKPELGIITNTPGQITGIDFDDPRYSKYLMFVGSFSDRGFLDKAAKPLLFKDNCLGNWSEWAEVFGMDKRVGYTRSQGDDRINFIKALRDIGSNAYGVFMEGDKVEYLGTQRSDAYQVYLRFCEYVDSQVAKLVFGQDVISNNTGKVVGTVGENVANMYGDSDAAFIKNLVNKRLIPLMENLGFSFGGHVFDWDNTERLKLSDRVVVDKAINDMGFQHSEEYINKTYGTEVEKKEEPKEEPTPMNDKLRALYKYEE